MQLTVSATQDLKNDHLLCTVFRKLVHHIYTVPVCTRALPGVEPGILTHFHSESSPFDLRPRQMFDKII